MTVVPIDIADRSQVSAAVSGSSLNTFSARFSRISVRDHCKVDLQKSKI